jgi:hypothetical protein
MAKRCTSTARPGPSDAVGLTIGDLRVALESSTGIDSTMNSYVAERMAAAPADDTEIEIDFSDPFWECIFQDVARRSADDFSYCCSS